MNKLLIALIATLTIGATLPAFAGPDWQLTEQARKAKLAQAPKEAAQQSDTTTAAQQADKDAKMGKMMKESMNMKNPAARVISMDDLYRGH